MIFKNGFIIDKDFKIIKSDLRISGDLITEIKDNIDAKNNEVIDAKDCYILPGFIDTHIHGAYGMRVSDDNPNYDAFTKFEATKGVTAVTITTAASTIDNLIIQFKNAIKASKNTKGTKILGIHAEGPFLSRNHKGAMIPDNIIPPDIDKLKRLVEASEGFLKVMTIAPEIPGAVTLIDYLVKNNITVSLGHTDAKYDEALLAFKHGATQLTHTFNAMRSYHHREPGILGAGLTNPDITLEVICDFIHLHPATVKLLYDIKSKDKIKIISDSGNAAGLEIKEFEVEGVKRYIKDGVIRLADGTIAGSAKTVLEGVQNLLSLGIPINEVSKMASYNPAKSIHTEDTVGSIDVGKKADIVILDKKYNIVSTYIDGRRKC